MTIHFDRLDSHYQEPHVMGLLQSLTEDEVAQYDRMAAHVNSVLGVDEDGTPSDVRPEDFAALSIGYAANGYFKGALLAYFTRVIAQPLVEQESMEV